MPRLARLVCAAALVLAAAGCAEPPSKEMNQAKGAIDAARAAGADQYASTEFSAAVDALARSEQAVVQNDYRLALSLAIESRERAQAAARVAVENRVKARGDAERALAQASLLLTQATARLDDPQLARAPRRALAGPRQALDAARKTMQEARAALERDDYRRALTLINGIQARIQAAVEEIDGIAEAPTGRRRR